MSPCRAMSQSALPAVGWQGCDVMSHAAQAHRVCDHYLAELASTGPADLNVCAVSLAGPRWHPACFAQDGEDGLAFTSGTAPGERRSEERRVGKECRSRWSPDH